MVKTIAELKKRVRKITACYIKPLEDKINKLEKEEREKRISKYLPLLLKKYNFWCDNTGHLCPNQSLVSYGESCKVKDLNPIERAIRCRHWIICVGDVTGSHTTVYGDVLPEYELSIGVPELLPLVPRNMKKFYKENIARATKAGFISKE
jgi:hypothetical protein